MNEPDLRKILELPIEIMVSRNDEIKIYKEMGLSSGEKREIIDNVQIRIDEWIGRSYMTAHEAILLNGKHYPFKIQIKPLLIGLITNSFLQTNIRYSELSSLIAETDVKTAEENLFRYAIDNYLTYCFGG